MTLTTAGIICCVAIFFGIGMTVNEKIAQAQSNLVNMPCTLYNQVNCQHGVVHTLTSDSEEWEVSNYYLSDKQPESYSTHTPIFKAAKANLQKCNLLPTTITSDSVKLATKRLQALGRWVDKLDNNELRWAYYYNMRPYNKAIDKMKEELGAKVALDNIPAPPIDIGVEK